MLGIFSTGLGGLSVALCAIFIALVIVSVKRGQKSGIIILSILAVVCIVYLCVGISVLFKPPYRESGSAYFSSNISESRIQDYFTKDASNENAEPLKMLNPDAETYNTKQIVYKDGSLCTADFQNAVNPDSRIEQVLYTYEDISRAKAAYAEQKNNFQKMFSENYLSEKNGLIEVETEKYAVCIFPITHDGVRWLLPFVDSNGTTLQILIRYDNQCLEIRESSESGKLTLPDSIF